MGGYVKTITYDDSLYCLVLLEPDANQQTSGAGSIRFDTTPINKLWTANKIYKAMLAASPMTILPQSTQPEPNLIAADGCCDFD